MIIQADHSHFTNEETEAQRERDLPKATAPSGVKGTGIWVPGLKYSVLHPLPLPPHLDFVRAVVLGPLQSSVITYIIFLTTWKMGVRVLLSPSEVEETEAQTQEGHMANPRQRWDRNSNSRIPASSCCLHLFLWPPPLATGDTRHHPWRAALALPIHLARAPLVLCRRRVIYTILKKSKCSFTEHLKRRHTTGSFPKTWHYGRS